MCAFFCINSRTYNTWEPEENLDCPGLVEKFEKEYALKETSSDKSKRQKAPAYTDESDAEMNRGFSRGYEPEAIVGATDATGKLMFLMQWKNSPTLDLVYAKTANQRCPQVVIAFYQQSLRWSPSDNCDKFFN